MRFGQLKNAKFLRTDGILLDCVGCEMLKDIVRVDDPLIIVEEKTWCLGLGWNNVCMRILHRNRVCRMCTWDVELARSDR